MSLSQLHQCDGVYRPPRRNLMRAISSDVKRFNNVKLIRLIDKMWLKQFALISILEILEWNSPALCCYPTGEGTILSIWTTTKRLGKTLAPHFDLWLKNLPQFLCGLMSSLAEEMGGFNLKWFSKLKRWIYRGFTFFGTQILQETWRTCGYVKRTDLSYSIFLFFNFCWHELNGLRISWMTINLLLQITNNKVENKPRIGEDMFMSCAFESVFSPNYEVYVESFPWGKALKVDVWHPDWRDLIEDEEAK